MRTRSARMALASPETAALDAWRNYATVACATATLPERPLMNNEERADDAESDVVSSAAVSAVDAGGQPIGASSGVNSSPASPKEHSVDVDDTVKPDAAASDGGTQTDDSNNVAAVHGEEAVPARSWSAASHFNALSLITELAVPAAFVIESCVKTFTRMFKRVR